MAACRGGNVCKNIGHWKVNNTKALKFYMCCLVFWKSYMHTIEVDIADSFLK